MIWKRLELTIMKNSKLFFGLTAVAFGWIVLLAQRPAAAGASASSFVCDVAAGAQSTNVITADVHKVPVIRWISSTFNDAGWSQPRRCH